VFLSASIHIPEHEILHGKNGQDFYRQSNKTKRKKSAP